MKVYLDICSYNRPYDPQDQLSVAMEAQSKLHIQNLIKEQMDYTKWQRQYFDAMAPGEFGKKALEYAKEHPFKGKAKRI